MKLLILFLSCQLGFIEYYFYFTILTITTTFQVIGNWLKYAQWEESQKQVQRARSIYERALDVDHRNVTLW